MIAPMSQIRGVCALIVLCDQTVLYADECEEALISSASLRIFLLTRRFSSIPIGLSW